MSSTIKDQSKKLEEAISRAIKKVRAKKEFDLCKYIPAPLGGHIHHFTLRKMKTKEPIELESLIEKFILRPDRPLVVPPKQRAARGSRKKKGQLTFTKLQLERLLNMARLAGDKEMISILSPKKSLAQCKRELIQSIRQETIDHELWNTYVEAVNAQQSLLAIGAEALLNNE